MYELMITGIVFLSILGVVFLIIFQHLCAILGMEIQKAKGYEPKYWIGYIFGPLGWLFCFVLPDLEMQKTLKEIAKKNKEEK